MKVKDIIEHLEDFAPRVYQESYDNSGLLVGNAHDEIEGVLLTLDVTEDVIDEAIANGVNLIVAHHPLIFTGLKKISGDHWVERCVIKAIKNDICIYAIHTNLDNMQFGINHRIAERIGLINTTILSPKPSMLSKLVTFVPPKDLEVVKQNLHSAGAGSIGNYDQCSFQVSGSGTFKPNDHANPTIGSKQKVETVEEVRLEMIFPVHVQYGVIDALKGAHPYEEVAYYITGLNNNHQEIGAGLIGQLKEPVDTHTFLTSLKSKMNTACIRHTQIHKKSVSKIAVCGGSGSFLLKQAMRQNADVFITGDFKYHEFFEADKQIVIADIGHYESEQFTKDLLFDILSKKFANIALRLSEEQTNPIKYL